jgi:hypothetical protein
MKFQAYLSSDNHRLQQVSPKIDTSAPKTGCVFFSSECLMRGSHTARFASIHGQHKKSAR